MSVVVLNTHKLEKCIPRIKIKGVPFPEFDGLGKCRECRDDVIEWVIQEEDKELVCGTVTVRTCGNWHEII